MRFDGHDLITLAEAAKLIPGERHPATIWRWIHVGRCGVRLDALDVGGVLYTSREAIQAFCEAVTAAKQARSAEHAASGF
jgi:hypothetical protein